MSERIVACPECGGLRETYSADEGTQGFVPPSEAPRIACGVCGHDRAPAEDGPRCPVCGLDPPEHWAGCSRRVPAVERPSAEVARESDIDAVKHHANVLWMTGHVVEAKAYWRVLAAAREAERWKEDADVHQQAMFAEEARVATLRERVAALEAELSEARQSLYAVAEQRNGALSRVAALEALVGEYMIGHEADEGGQRCDCRICDAARAALAAEKEPTDG